MEYVQLGKSDLKVSKFVEDVCLSDKDQKDSLGY